MRVVYEDHEGYLWVGTTTGLNRFKSGTRVFRRYLQNTSGDIMNENYIIDVFEDSRKTLWIGTAKGLFIYNKEKDRLERVREWDALFPKSMAAVSIYEDKTRTLWFGTWAWGMLKKAIGGKLERVAKLGGETITSTVRSFYDNGDGNFWIGSGEGLLRYDRQKKSIQVFDENNGMVSKYVTSIMFDRSGIVWAGTRYGGVCKYNPHKQRFVYYPLNDKKKGKQ